MACTCTLPTLVDVALRRVPPPPPFPHVHPDAISGGLHAGGEGTYRTDALATQADQAPWPPVRQCRHPSGCHAGVLHCLACKTRPLSLYVSGTHRACRSARRTYKCSPAPTCGVGRPLSIFVWHAHISAQERNVIGLHASLQRCCQPCSHARILCNTTPERLGCGRLRSESRSCVVTALPRYAGTLAVAPTSPERLYRTRPGRVAPVA